MSVSEVEGQITVWSFPGALLWVPTAVNAFIGIEIIQLAIDHSRGHFDGFDGFDIAMQIFIASIPIAAVLGMAWIILVVLKTRVRKNSNVKRALGCLVLSGANVIAPGVLFLGLRWVS